MNRSLHAPIRADLSRKMVFLTGPRQVGKTTLCKQILAENKTGQYFNWDILHDRRIIQRQSWIPTSDMLVFDEIHKMSNWKNWLKGVVDGKSVNQALLITGSASMETWRQSGESLAGRYYRYRLHPVSVREWCDVFHESPPLAFERLLIRGGFPEPLLAESNELAQRWRQQYLTDLIREDVVEYSRISEIKTMQLFVELLRERVGSPLSLANIARDLAIAPATLRRYLGILESLYVVFLIQPYHHNIARATLQMPKVYFFDNGLVRGDEGIRFENATAVMLKKHSDFLQDHHGINSQLHYLRTKDHAEVDFALSEDLKLTHLVECKESDTKPHSALMRFAKDFPQTKAVQLVHHLRQEEFIAPITITHAAQWLAGLAA